jgi:phosphoglycerate dehydrogenase-like enzyme
MVETKAFSAARPRILIHEANFSPEQIAELKASASRAEIILVGRSEAEQGILENVGEVDALLTDILTSEMLARGKKLKWIQCYASGVDDILFPELQSSEIVLTNCKIIQGPEIAEHAFALLLALTRWLPETLADQKEEMWSVSRYRRPEDFPVELSGRTALVIGLGGIGMQIAQRAHAFGMKVVGIDPKDIPYVMFVEETFKPDQLHELLPLADVIFMAAPLTRKTFGMLGRREFNLMKQGGFLISVSRGKTVDTTALVMALEEGRLAGAGLDVTEPAPLPKGHPLWRHPNVIITPHMSGQSDKAWDRRFALVKENLRRFLEGRELRNVVDKAEGY